MTTRFSDGSKRQPARTTIVGGQPPGNERELPPIPMALEDLMCMAAVDPRYARALREDRTAALSASGLEFTASELAILASIDDATLERMISHVGVRVPRQHRREFLSLSSAALLALVGGATLVGPGCDREQPAREPAAPVAPSDRIAPAPTLDAVPPAPAAAPDATGSADAATSPAATGAADGGAAPDGAAVDAEPARPAPVKRRRQKQRPPRPRKQRSLENDPMAGVSLKT